MAVTKRYLKRKFPGNHAMHEVIDYISAPTLVQVLSNFHMEKGTLKGTIDFLTHTINHVFQLPFTSQPLEVVLDVYKMEKQADGTFVKQPVPCGYVTALHPTTLGFDLQINSLFTPDLTGVIIKFKFEQF